MAQTNASVGTTLTSGIQDISALLPLLGTEQCEEHIGSGLTGGFLYVAATPMSIFGSLGMARAGFKGLLASISFSRWRFIGAQKLQDAGFAPSGANLSLIMMDPNNKHRHLAETKLDSLLAALHIEDVERLTVVTQSKTWNLKMYILTAILCAIGVTPYIHLNLHDRNNFLPGGTRWAFPVIRVIGSFFAATSVQLLLQRRLIALLKNRLTFLALDAHVRAINPPLLNGNEQVLWDEQKPSEMCLWSLERALCRHRDSLWRRLLRSLGFRAAESGGPVHNESNLEFPPDSPSPTDKMHHSNEDVESGVGERQAQIDSLRTKLAEVKTHFVVGNETIWPFLILTALGIAASVIGYIGCFSVVQGAKQHTGPLIWLAVEGVLSIIRMALWGWNPDSDDLDPLTFSLKLNKYPPLPTCNKSEEEIVHNRSLPLARATEFLEAITAHAGLVKRFDHPDLSLFYTLTRKAANAPGISQRILYITIFDHKERTTRIYYEDADENTKFLSGGDLHIDTKHGIVKVAIMGNHEFDDDPVVRNQSLHSELQEHYRSIMAQLQFRVDEPGRTVDTVENDWTLELANTSSAMNRQATDAAKQKKVKGTGLQDPHMPNRSVPLDVDSVPDASTVESDDAVYLKQGNLQRKVSRLFEKRGLWIEDYMAHIRTQYAAEMEEARREKMATDTELEQQKELEEWMLLYERVKMESNLLDEMQSWEEILRSEHEQMLESVIEKRKSDSDWRALEERLAKDWVVNAWSRLSQDKDVTFARLTRETKKMGQRLSTHQARELGEVWQLAVMNIQKAWSDLYSTQRATISERVAHKAEAILQMIDHRVQGALQIIQNELASERAHRLYRGRWRERTERLASETEDVINRVKRDLLPNCDDFWTSRNSAKLIFSRSKWTKVDLSDTGLDEGIKTITRALERNRRIFFIQFSRFYTHDLGLAEAISMIHDTTSVTTIAFAPDTEIGDKTRLALLAAVDQNEGITSICGLDLDQEPGIKQKLAQNQERARHNNRTFVTVYNFLIGENDDDLYGGTQSRVDLSFFGPMTGPLLLRLRHDFTKPPRVRMNDTVEISSVLDSVSFQPKDIRLEPIRHFIPNSPNVLSILPVEERYTLRDIDLLDGQGASYVYTEVDRHMVKASDVVVTLY